LPQLSAHFHSNEFACRDGTPAPSHAYDELRALCHDYLEPLRGRYGRTVVRSGYRTPAWNRRVLGAPDSFHVYRRERYGAAADVTCERGHAPDWHAFLAALDPPGLGHYVDHVHVDNRHGHARW
jgi:hypothetical protein